MKNWQDQTIFYQIYMPSFCDGNNDGIGDFKGITSKLDYLKKLGIGGIWLTPFYPSPKVDNGYDISDYYSIDPDYGTMEEFENFLKSAHEKGIRVIVDIVINHTSDKHPWFLESKSSRENSKRDWYIWKKPESGKIPNNWESFFGGSAWEWDEVTEEYYYHSFAREQADLNWGNPEVKKAILEMFDYWIDKGVDGFRLDVINNLTLGKVWTDNPQEAAGKQNHLYDVNQKGIHEILREIREHVKKRKEIFLVGEISSDNLQVIHSYAAEGELHTTFNFNLGSKEVFRIADFYQELCNMQKLYQKQKPTLFFGSHDMGRFPSRFGFDKNKIKTLLTFLMTFRGYPFLYFGDEIGMESLILKEIGQARDVQGILAYERAISEGKTMEDALLVLNKEGRDKSRNVMKWDDTSYYGFSDCLPWLFSNEKNLSGNVASEEINSDSILNYTKKITRFRNENDILCEGSLRLLPLKNDIIGYIREKDGRKLMILLNFSDKIISLNEVGIYLDELLLSTDNTNKKTIIMPGSAMIGVPV